jgi:nucleoside-diphosphate-sugar epimerase
VRVVIAGCGDVGTEVGLRLAAAGHSVVGIRRSPDRLPAPIIGVRGDLAAGHVEELPDDTELVVYAAAAEERTEAAYLGAYLAGPRHVLDALARVRARPRRLVFVSSTAVYGVDDGSWVDEATPAEPRTVTGEVLLAAEQAVLERAPQPTALRLSGIYGPGRTRLLAQVRDGRAVVPEPPVFTNRIHRDDAAAAIVHLLARREEPDPILLGSDHEPAERGEVLRWLAEQLDVPPPPTAPDERSRGGNKRCRNGRLLATGFAFAYPTYREGYTAVLRGAGARHP